ncbi:MAG: DUF3604 domain-containing protein [Planctomycetota bacterium]
MTEQRHDRIIPLSELSSYPGSDFLDMVLWLPPDETTVRRAWVLCSSSSPVLSVVAESFKPAAEEAGPPRWVDYGAVELPIPPSRCFMQLRVRGLDAEEVAGAWLLVARDAEFSPAGLSLEEAERKLWGLARRDAGSTELSPSWVEVGTGADFRVRYTAGGQGLPPEALVRFSIPKAFPQPQSREGRSAGYVFTEHADRAVSTPKAEPSVESHEKWDLTCRLPEGLGPGEGFDLVYRSDWSYIFATEGVFRETDRRYWYTKQPLLGAAAAVSAEAPFVSLLEENSHVSDFLAGPAERLHLVLPGRRRAGEPLTLRGLWTDRYRNFPPRGLEHRSTEVWLECDGREVGRWKAREHAAGPHRFEISLPDLPPGVYRAGGASRSPGFGAVSNPMEVIAAEDGRDPVFWGEIHCHSEMSDGLGGFEDLYRFAREEACLDFAAAADHACYFTDNQWEWMQDVTNSADEPGRFVTLVGYEWAGNQVHRNVYTSRDRLKLFRGMYRPTSNLDAVYPHLTGDRQVVAGPHAPLAHGIKWEHHDPYLERFVEIYSMWGASDEREDNPLLPLAARGAGEYDSSSDRKSVRQLLETGARLGFTGGGDCHEARPGFTCEDPGRQGEVPHNFAKNLTYRCGLTASVMPDLGRRELIEAIRERRTYATTGARILLDFSVGPLPMGSAGRCARAVCRAAVHAIGRIAALEVIGSGGVLHRREPGTLDAELVWTDPQPPRPGEWYYLRVIQEDGQRAWSSPVWIDP